MKRGGFAPEVVTVAPTSTTVVEVDTRQLSTLCLYVHNTDLTQTFAGTIQRRMTPEQDWAPSSFGDFATITAGVAVMADLDVQTTAYLRLVGTMDGAGGDVSVSGADRTLR